MKNRPLVTIACLLIALMSGAGARTFTNTEGKQIEAELVALEDEKAVLKLANGRNASVPLASLSAEDQAFAKTWHEENKNKITGRDLKLKIEKEVERVKNDAGAGGKNNNKNDTTEILFKCTLENYSGKTIEGLSANYTIYKRTSTRGERGSETDTSENSDSSDVPTLKPKESVEFVAGPEVCVDFQKSSNKGAGQSQREKVLGIVITLMNGETEILKQSEPRDFIDRLEEEAKRQEARDRGRK